MSLGYAVHLCSKQLKQSLNKRLEPFDLTAAQFSVLKEIEKVNENELKTQVVVCRSLGMDKPTITGIVQRLTHKELVIKHKHPTDKRSFTLTLSPQAVELMSILEAESDKVIEQAVQGCSPESIEQMTEFLMKMVKQLQRGDQ